MSKDPSRETQQGGTSTHSLHLFSRLSTTVALPSIMAWRCSGKSNKALIQNLKKAGIVKSDSVLEAMLKVQLVHTSSLFVTLQLTLDAAVPD